MEQTLSADERARAARFHFKKDRNHFIVARGLLRTILGCYLNMEPDQLRFCYNEYGKPSLASEFGENRLCFNLSHADGLALYAVSRGRELGIDVERLRPDFADEQVAERFFSPREVVALRTLPEHMQRDAFFRCWTRKEAYIKAKGEGLSLPLDQFDVSVNPGEATVLLRINSNPQEAARWLLRELITSPGYVAALAVEGRDWGLKYRKWPEF